MGLHYHWRGLEGPRGEQLAGRRQRQRCRQKQREARAEHNELDEQGLERPVRGEAGSVGRAFQMKGALCEGDVSA